LWLAVIAVVPLAAGAEEAPALGAIKAVSIAVDA
jgi:hypothetical protein